MRTNNLGVWLILCALMLLALWLQTWKPKDEDSPTLYGQSIDAYVSGPISRDGVRARGAIPAQWHQKNTGGSDGAGLCVYASARHTGLMQGDPVFEGMFEWMRRFPGGSYPSKFRQSVERYAREKGLPVPRWMQMERADWALVQRAAQAGRVPGVTYSVSPTGRYGGRRIAHMVSLVHADESRVCILDNNYIGENAYEWMTLNEGRRAGLLDWVIVLLTPGVPPAPHNGD
jgi:hypothetical protein